jgi:DNA mismatch repair protein MutS
MEQFGRIKRAHPEAILFFRVGDFYETFHDDAVEAARLLGITLTSRNKNDPHPIPLAGIPWHQRDVYVARLLRQGRRVAICEQLEDPAQAKGLVDRGVTEVLTPGSVVQDAFLVAGESNYLAAIAPAEAGAAVGVALVEASTGEFLVGEFAPADAAAELSRYGISEFLVPVAPPLPRALEAILFTARTVTRLPQARFAAAAAPAVLAAHFGPRAAGVADDAPQAQAAAAAALVYLGEVQGSALTQVRRLVRLAAREHLGLDPATRRSLELFTPAPGGDAAHTLWAVLDRTRTPAGARRLRALIERPLVDPAAIATRQDAVEVLVEDATRRAGTRARLDRTYDLERLAARTAAGKANGRDLVALRDTLLAVPELAAHLGGGGATPPGLARVVAALDPHAALAELLGRALVDEPPVTIQEGGLIRPGYDPALDELRTVAGDGKRWLAAFEQEEREGTGIPSLKVGYNRVFGYHIEITRAHLSRVPAHYERRQTLTGAERFVTPALREKEAQVLGAEERLRQAEHDCFVGLRERAAADFESLQATARALAELDALASLAEVAAQAGWTRPRVHGGDRLHLLASRHPVVERLLPPGRFVPNDVDLDPARRQIVLLTGPNMAGKSTYMRQVALCVLLAQAGSFVPARAADIGVVDRIFTRVGAGDHVAGGQSTFMLEMLETANILKQATARSLVVLDEIGRGTSTYDGMSLAWAVTEELAREGGPRPRTLFATHYHELTRLAEHLPRVVNRSVKVKEVGDEVAFLHEVVDGPADKSYGIHVARLAGLPAPVVARAREILALLEASRPDPLDPAALFVPAPAGRVADRRAARPRPAGPAGPQLPLFGEGDPRAAGLLAALEALDLEALSPREAVAWLYAWKERLAAGAAGRGSPESTSSTFS